MVKVVVERTPDNAIVSFFVKGHSHWSKAGTNIQCAAVSAITQTAVIGLEEWLQLHPEVETSPGYLFCRLQPNLDPPAHRRAQDILETMVYGLRGIAAEDTNSLHIQERRKTDA